MRCKFVCDQIAEQVNWNRDNPPLKTVRMKPVSSGAAENQQFYAAVPKGLLELDLLRAEAASGFVLGREYYLEITEAPEHT